METLISLALAGYALGVVYSHFKTGKTWAEAAKWPLRLFAKKV
jgi:hypothetical protein